MLDMDNLMATADNRGDESYMEHRYTTAENMMRSRVDTEYRNANVLTEEAKLE